MNSTRPNSPGCSAKERLSISVGQRKWRRGTQVTQAFYCVRPVSVHGPQLFPYAAVTPNFDLT